MRVAMTLEQCWHRVPGGTAVAALELARALGERDDVDLVGVAARHRDPPSPAYRPPPGLAMAHLKLPRPLLYEAWHYLRCPRLQRATGPVDVVHATTIVVPPRSAPLVVTVHDLAFLHEPAHFTRRGRRVFLRGLDLLRRQADLVLCSSSATRDDCLATGIGAERLRVVTLGVRVEPATDEDTATVRQRLGLPRPYVLFTGTLEPRKNVAGLVAAFERWSQERADDDHELVLVGPAGWGDTGTGGHHRVRALGFVDAATLRALYRGADVFAYPSLREGFGLPVLEAMAQGVPVVTSKGASTEEVAGGAAVLVDPRHIEDIARGLDEALARRDELAEAGRRRAAEMTWDRTAELTVAAYREVS